MAKKYIDADEAFEIITDFAGQADTKSAYKAFWKSANALKTQPAADVAEVKHKKWLGNDGEYKCTGCGEFNCYKPNYCPTCGAKMKGADV